MGFEKKLNFTQKISCSTTSYIAGRFKINSKPNIKLEDSENKQRIKII